MVQLKARHEFPYSGRMLSVGERFDATPEHALLLTTLGRAEHVVEAGSHKKPKKQRRYKRRDMRAEA